MKRYKQIILTFALILWCTSFCEAEELQVWSIERPPFAYMQAGEWTGFSIDLWNEIAQRRGLEYSFQEYEAFSDMIAATGSWSVDLSVANISITYGREKTMDFSQPIFDSGLNILAKKDEDNLHWFLSFFTNDLPKVLLYIVLWLIGLTHFFWIRNVFRWVIPVYTYFTEIFAVFFEIMRQIKDAYGLRILFTTILGVCVFFVSFYSQKIATVYANQNEAVAEKYVSSFNNIEIEELKNLQVWVTQWSTSEKYMKRKKIETVWYDDLEQMISDLWDKKLDVIVHDDPLLRFFVENEGKWEYVVVRKIFQPEKFGIAFREGSDLRESVDRAILEIHEDGRYDEIYKEYFGEE